MRLKGTDNDFNVCWSYFVWSECFRWAPRRFSKYDQILTFYKTQWRMYFIRKLHSKKIVNKVIVICINEIGTFSVLSFIFSKLYYRCVVNIQNRKPTYLWKHKLNRFVLSLFYIIFKICKYWKYYETYLRIKVGRKYIYCARPNIKGTKHI